MKFSRISRQLTAVCLSGVLLATQLSNALAQGAPDTYAPVIELEAVAESIADNSQVFTAQVADDKALKDVTFYYRREGQTPFKSLPMKQILDTGYYTVSVETDPNDLRTIQYYLQARDQGGNRTVEGFAFDPYSRIILANESLIAQSAPAANLPASNTSTSKRQLKWWHIALGVVAVGALASASSSNGGGDGTVADPNRVRFTVNVPGL